MDIELQITAQGGVQMLHSDAVDLRELGEIKVTRASHVEFCPLYQCWKVISAKTGKLLASGFKSRVEALGWEKTFYSPSGPGWKEITKGE